MLMEPDWMLVAQCMGYQMDVVLARISATNENVAWTALTLSLNLPWIDGQNAIGICTRWREITTRPRLFGMR